MKTPHILAISSYAVHGTASLKTFTSVLGEKILPVPSLLLNGLTNMSLVKKFDTPFRELLQGTFDLAADRELELILYIGYLGKAEQADIILEMMDTYRDRIKMIITDPVCGDHGRTYVPAEVIAKWPQLISRSNMVFPNLTEIRILTGNDPAANEADDVYIGQFKERYPVDQVVITSIKTGTDGIGVKAFGKENYSYSHKMLPRNYGGSGDAFLALFMLNRFYKQMSFHSALRLAADRTHYMIQNSINKGSDDLILSTNES